MWSAQLAIVKKGLTHLLSVAGGLVSHTARDETYKKTHDLSAFSERFIGHPARDEVAETDSRPGRIAGRSAHDETITKTDSLPDHIRSWRKSSTFDGTKSPTHILDRLWSNIQIMTTRTDSLAVDN